MPLKLRNKPLPTSKKINKSPPKHMPILCPKENILLIPNKICKLCLSLNFLSMHVRAEQ